MQTWVRRIRGAIGMGLIWGVAWSCAGGLLARLPGVDSDLPLPLLFAPLGFVTGIIFSGIIATIESGRGNDRISLPRFAGWGAVGGVLLAGIFAVAAALGGRSMWGEILLFGPALATAGAVSAAGSLTLARRAETRALPDSSGDPAEERRELPGRRD